jgi:hypothetical protein
MRWSLCIKSRILHLSNGIKKCVKTNKSYLAIGSAIFILNVDGLCFSISEVTITSN